MNKQVHKYKEMEPGKTTFVDFKDLARRSNEHHAQFKQIVEWDLPENPGKLTSIRWFPKQKCLVFMKGEYEDYPTFFLRDMKNTAKIMDTILQVVDKSWATAPVSGVFIKAVREICYAHGGLQGKICPFGAYMTDIKWRLDTNSK